LTKKSYHVEQHCRVVEYAVSMENLNLSAIRTIRVLRPLRAINRIPSAFYRLCVLIMTVDVINIRWSICFSWRRSLSSVAFDESMQMHFVIRLL